EPVHNRCCSPDAMAHARHVAEMLDIPFYVVDAQEVFKRTIVEFFIDGYARGVTPNPCIECNRHIRWEFLLNKALSLGATHLATGHYARGRQSPLSRPERGPRWKGEIYQLCKSVDDKKDQSYVLSVLGQAQLKHALFPVGDYTKPQIRDMARRFNLPTAERPDSQDLCFLADNDYRRFLSEHAPEIVQPGPIINTDGNVIGQHRGLPFYTIGQRKGIGIAAAEALYVLGTEPARNALVVGVEAELGQNTMRVGQINWVSGTAPTQPFECAAKIRYKAVERPCRVTPLDNARVGVTFEEPARDVTPGQSAVFYDGDVCLGGGIIQR
ncbi:MAG: tRNA 2-thiouridine(34) synthase MnmA, partial [Chloroflexota bacterium]